MQNRTISIRTKQGLTVISGTSCWRWSFWRRRRFYNWIAGRTPTKNYITKKIEKLYWEYVFKMSGWNFRQIRNFSRIKMGTSWRIIFVSKYYRSDMDNRCLCQVLFPTGFLNFTNYLLDFLFVSNVIFLKKYNKTVKITLEKTLNS